MRHGAVNELPLIDLMKVTILGAFSTSVKIVSGPCKVTLNLKLISVLLQQII